MKCKYCDLEFEVDESSADKEDVYCCQSCELKNGKKKIKDRTWISCHLIDEKGKMKSSNHTVMFKDFKNFEDLPGPCKCVEVKKDFKRYWRQKKGDVK